MAFNKKIKQRKAGLATLYHLQPYKTLEVHCREGGHRTHTRAQGQRELPPNPHRACSGTVGSTASCLLEFLIMSTGAITSERQRLGTTLRQVQQKTW